MEEKQKQQNIIKNNMLDAKRDAEYILKNFTDLKDRDVSEQQQFTDVLCKIITYIADNNISFHYKQFFYYELLVTLESNIAKIFLENAIIPMLSKDQSKAQDFVRCLITPGYGSNHSIISDLYKDNKTEILELLHKNFKQQFEPYLQSTITTFRKNILAQIEQGDTEFAKEIQPQKQTLQIIPSFNDLTKGLHEPISTFIATGKIQPTTSSQKILPTDILKYKRVLEEPSEDQSPSQKRVFDRSRNNAEIPFKK